MTMPHPDVNTDSDNGSNNDDDPLGPDVAAGKRSPANCLLVGLALVATTCVVAYFVQGLILPEVDPDQTRAVVIGNSSDDNRDPKGSDEHGVPATPDLPDGAITAGINQQIIDSADHPFDPLIKVASLSLAEIDKNIQDYTATLVSQVFVNDTLQDEKYLQLKIRHPQSVAGQEFPFAVYTKFLKPKASIGQEAIWVRSQNDGKLIAHASGLLNIKRAYLDPDGPMAMKGNRYPIRDIGFRNLIAKMVDIGEKDRQRDECTVTIMRKVEINGCTCSMFEAVHPTIREHFDFHIARIYIDDNRNIPIAYEGYLWPEKAGDEPPLLEKYYYTDIKLNVGLTDDDFDPGNEEYNYPRW